MPIHTLHISHRGLRMNNRNPNAVSQIVDIPHSVDFIATNNNGCTTLARACFAL